jgi:hypothetical protein
MFLAEAIESHKNNNWYLNPICNECNTQTVAISQSSQSTFCPAGSVTLTANVTGLPATSYLWSTGATTQSIEITGNGTYSVTVTNSTGGHESASTNVTISGALSSYVILGGEEVNLDSYNNVLSGGVGVLGETDCENNPGTLIVNNHSNITATGTFGTGNTITVTNSSAVTNQTLARAGITLPYFKEMTCTSSNNVTVANNATVTLTDTLYNQITLGTHSTVIFSQPVVNICDNFTLGQFSTVKFMHCGIIRLKKGLSPSASVTWNPDAYNVVAYSEADIQFKEGTIVKGIFYCGTTTECQGIIQTEHNFNMTGTSGLPDNFYGLVLAEHVKGDYTNWNSADFCGNCVPKKAELKADVLTGPVIRNYPNPFSEKTTIMFILPADNHVTLDIYDLSGKLIQTLYNDNVVNSQEYKVEFDGTTLPTGIYIYKMTTNEDVYTGKMILNKE